MKKESQHAYASNAASDVSQKIYLGGGGKRRGRRQWPKNDPIIWPPPHFKIKFSQRNFLYFYICLWQKKANIRMYPTPCQTSWKKNIWGGGNAEAGDNGQKNVPEDLTTPHFKIKFSQWDFLCFYF
jgi:hypothetical protein